MIQQPLKLKIRKRIGKKVMLRNNKKTQQKSRENVYPRLQSPVLPILLLKIRKCWTTARKDVKLIRINSKSWSK